MTEEEYFAACERRNELWKKSIWTQEEKKEFDDLSFNIWAYNWAKQGDDDVQND